MNAGCFLIDDILKLFVELDYNPYGVSKSLNELIKQRDTAAGLDEAAARCCRMIEFAKSYAKRHGEEPDEYYSRIYLVKVIQHVHVYMMRLGLKK